MSRPIRFGLIGLGWRGEQYVRIARQLPQWFEPAGVVVRNPDKYRDLAARLGLRLCRTPQELARDCDFVVAAVAKAAAPAVLAELAAHGIPVLAETPPAHDSAALRQMEAVAAQSPRIQVAEQYPLLPHHAARSALIRSGALGEVRHVQVSAGHGYHGIALIRRWLDLRDERCRIVAQQFTHPVLEVPVRGRDTGDGVELERHDIALLSFEGGKSAVYDFTRSQYFSPLRQNRVLIRGSHGEIRDNEVTRSLDSGMFDTLTIRRIQDGMEGSLAPLSLRELWAGSERLYISPFYPAPLSDEELAIAETLVRMDDYIRTGTSFYSLTEALVDVRLSLAIETAIASGVPVTAP
ncbi:Gfo/Idh/MocA family protein [Paenibacillus tepidiphilus]|uniref:Gfo/Idh/MocA family protein n=1 Tax=Paenibacillus tepidiphilus TaxID=2608683 RepID=UPI0013A55671|nr:Gfo/Idh/MocA family oxidoreductase [Paenibacillus tepidiphilus]